MQNTPAGTAYFNSLTFKFTTMTKKFTTLQLFSVVDGRISTTMDDVYDVLNHVCDTSLQTARLPLAMDYLEEKNPKWFLELQIVLKEHEMILNSTDFQKHIAFINVEGNNRIYDIPQLKDEFDTSDFGEYMMGNSLLLNK